MLFIIIPTVLSTIGAISNYASVSFGVYLKYQAMVDTYYFTQQQEQESDTLALQKLTEGQKVQHQ